MAHRDLKPENLLLKENTENIHVKIADFGFAKVDRGDLITPQFTPYYASPQVRYFSLILSQEVLSGGGRTLPKLVFA